MTPEQKQTAQNLIDDFKGAGNEWDEAAVASHMAALLQELVDAPEPEPEPVAVIDNAAPGLINWYSWKATNLPDGTNLYTTPPAPSVPDGFNPLETVKYWAETYSSIASGSHFHGHGKAAELLREYAQLREMLAAAPTPAELLTTTNPAQISSSPAEAPAQMKGQA